MAAMRNHPKWLGFLICCAFFAGPPAGRAQSSPAAGAIEFSARVTPTAARPEPVRQFTFYLLTKSYADIAREAEASDPMPTREQFIAGLKVTPQLKEWMKAHDTIDLTSSEIENVLTPDDVVKIQEFEDAYIRANSGGVTRGLPRPKYTEADRTANSERYQQLRQEYLAALRKFIAANPNTLAAIEAYLDSANPGRQWNQLASAHRSRMLHRAPEIAQTRYLAGKADTDLNGHASFSGIPAGTYWISTLDLDAAAGDSRLRWDVAVTVQPGQTTRLELTNLNAAEKQTPAP
jgi:hypothetical protein